jgi:dephospho-CoA kinase
MTEPWVIGLTGGIATGKSTVADYLAFRYGLPILDADQYAREAVAPGSAILTTITEHFGPQVLLSDGSLDRATLGELVFNDPGERQWLEAQIHPYVRAQMQAECQSLTQAGAEMLVMVIPLLFEANLESLVSEIWVVNCSEALQRQRLMQRNHLTPVQAEARIASQMPLAKKVALADVVLDNTGSVEALQDQVDRLLEGS